MPTQYGDILAQKLASIVHLPVAAEANIADIPLDDRQNGQTVKAIAEGTSWTYVAASTASGSATCIVPTDAPATGRWLIDFSTLATSVAGLAAQGTFTCLSGDAAGDWVYISAANTVAKADADDTAKLPVIGVIVSKPTTTSTSCVVQTTGQVTLSGLTAGAIYYLSGAAGAITATPVSANAVPIGIAKSTTVLVLLNSAFGAGDATVRGKLNVATSLGVGAAPLATGIVSAGPVVIPEYAKASLPSAVTYDNGVIIVSDEAGGRTLATSDGTNWKRVSDGATVS